MYSNTFTKALLFCLLCGSIWSTKALSQSHTWFAEAWVNPALVSLGSHGAVEYGQGYYDFRIRQGVSQEYGLSVGRRISPHWEAGVGVSHKYMRQNFGYTLTDPRDESQVLENPERSYLYYFLGTRAFGGLTLQRHSFRFIAELNFPLRTERNPDVTAFQTDRGFFFQNDAVGVSVDELLTPGMGSFGIFIPELNYGFHVNRALSLHTGIKWRGFDRAENYRLRITGNIPNGAGPEVVLNDVAIHNRFFMCYAGANIRMGWGRR